MASNDVTRKHITFHGSVQGVGFRYRAHHAANVVGCTGWVRNEWNGTVTMEIQGEESQIDRVIGGIEQGRYVWIEKMDCETVPIVEGEWGFRVR